MSRPFWQTTSGQNFRHLLYLCVNTYSNKKVLNFDIRKMLYTIIPQDIFACKTNIGETPFILYGSF